VESTENIERGTLDRDTPLTADPVPTLPPAAPDGAPPSDGGAPFVIDATRVGMWECLNDGGKCSLAAPDPRTPGKPFEGPIQGALEGPIVCPECKGEKVIYRGEKIDAAAVA